MELGAQSKPGAIDLNQETPQAHSEAAPVIYEPAMTQSKPLIDLYNKYSGNGTNDTF
jgi:hypothetical protein